MVTKRFPTISTKIVKIKMYSDSRIFYILILHYYMKEMGKQPPDATVFTAVC